MFITILEIVMVDGGVFADPIEGAHECVRFPIWLSSIPKNPRLDKTPKSMG
jgi:hypothetical protein